MSDAVERLEAPRRIEDASDVQFFAPRSGAQRVTLDLSPVTWIAPIGVVGLLALAHRAENGGLSQLNMLAPTDSRVRAFLARCGFLEALSALGARVNVQLTEPERGATIRPFLPATYVTGEREMEIAAEELVNILETLSAPPQATIAVYYVMTEMTNNAWQHGNSCYVVAQTHTGELSGRPGLELAIADLGPGFMETLKSYAYPSEAEAIVRAFDSGITGTGDATRGLGLECVMEAVDNYPGDAELAIVSLDSVVTRSNSKFHTLSEQPDCQGVFVTAYFPFRGR